METIYITGFTGTGKSMVGRFLASRKELKLLDINKKIEEIENRKIEEIFKTDGVAYYRNIEKDVLKKYVEQGMIVSVDTYIPQDSENRIQIKRTGRVIYLRAKADTICKNLKENNINDPLIENNYSIFTIEKKMNEMTPYYEELANYIIDIDGKRINEVFNEALAIYNYCNKIKCNIYIK